MLKYEIIMDAYCGKFKVLLSTPGQFSLGLSMNIQD